MGRDSSESREQSLRKRNNEQKITGNSGHERSSSTKAITAEWQMAKRMREYEKENKSQRDRMRQFDRQQETERYNENMTEIKMENDRMRTIEYEYETK